MNEQPRLIIASLLLALASTCACAETTPQGMAKLPEGAFRPLFGSAAAPREVQVKSFYLDAVPVTTAEFLEFVKANPAWQRSKVKRLFGDESYLKSWAGDLDPGSS